MPPREQKEKTPLLSKVTNRGRREGEVTAGQVLEEMHVTDGDASQKEDPKLDAVLHWLESKKKTDLRTLLGEHASSEEGWRICYSS